MADHDQTCAERSPPDNPKKPFELLCPRSRSSCPTCEAVRPNISPPLQPLSMQSWYAAAHNCPKSPQRFVMEPLLREGAPHPGAGGSRDAAPQRAPGTHAGRRIARCGHPAACPAFCHKPQTIQDRISHTIGKVLECFHIPTGFSSAGEYPIISLEDFGDLGFILMKRRVGCKPVRGRKIEGT